MSAGIFHTPYEIVGTGVPIAEAFYAEWDGIREQQMAFVSTFGAEGYVPGHSGGVASLLFKELPAGFRQIGKRNGLVQAVPHKGTKIGKEAAAKLAELPRAKQEQALSYLFGWSADRWVMDGLRGVIYRPVVVRLMLPSPRYLIQLPRETGDGFEPPETLRELTQTEYAAAYDAHNAAVRAATPEVSR